MSSALFVGLLALAVGASVPALAARARGRRYALFAGLVLALSLPGAVALHAWLAVGEGPLAAGLTAVFAWGIAAAGAHLASLVRARLRSAPFRWGVSVPGMAALALGAVAGPFLLLLAPLWAAAAALGLAHADAVLDGLAWLPVALVAASLVTSLRPRREHVRVRLGGARRPAPEDGAGEGGGRSPEEGEGGAAGAVVRLPVERSRRRLPPAEGRTLRLVQIADPHLGPWQPVARLARRVEELLAEAPDLVLLTGDFLTMEGQGSPGALAEALAPLRAAPGRCIAVFGNHDHEAPEEVRSALAANGVELLVDAERVVETRVGPVQILGADWVRRERAARLGALLERFPPRPGALRLLLLHDPLGFRDLPPGAVDLVLSGHTHGGQVGLLSLGIDWTVLRRSRWPDHGLFGRGASRLYVHRGTGFYGFPLRMGVPGEHSVLEVVLP